MEGSIVKISPLALPRFQISKAASDALYKGTKLGFESEMIPLECALECVRTRTPQVTGRQKPLDFSRIF